MPVWKVWKSCLKEVSREMSDVVVLLFLDGEEE